MVINHTTDMDLNKEEPQSEEMADSDSDAPEEISIAQARDDVLEKKLSYNNEISKLKKKVKEARRLKHERNKEQQIKKKEKLKKLESCRLPADLLEAVGNEKAAFVEPKGKRKVFDEDVEDDLDFLSETVDEEEVIPVQTNVQVQAVQQEVKKHKTIASVAADFRQQRLAKANRMSSVALRKMDVKQKKSGKNKFAS